MVAFDKTVLPSNGRLVARDSFLPLRTLCDAGTILTELYTPRRTTARRERHDNRFLSFTKWLSDSTAAVAVFPPARLSSWEIILSMNWSAVPYMRINFKDISRLVQLYGGSAWFILHPAPLPALSRRCTISDAATKSGYSSNSLPVRALCAALAVVTA